MPFQDNGVHEDGQQEFANWLDAQVQSGQMSADEAVRQAQEHGLTTGPGTGYMAPGQAQTDAATLNEQSAASAKQSAAYQESRKGNPEGYTQESQAEFNEAHPLSDYE